MDLEEARAFHDTVPVIDLHADTPKLMRELRYDLAQHHERPMPRGLNYVGHVDLPRLRAGGMAGQIFGLWTFPYPRWGSAASVHGQLDALDAAIAAYPDQLTWAHSPEEIAAARAAGKVAVTAAIEGGHALEGDLDHVAAFAARGVRSIGLVHLTPNRLGSPAFGVGKNQNRGLSPYGKDVVREMNRLGMIVDLAHISRAGFFDAIEVTQAPVMVTHTGVIGVHDHLRNIDDAQLRAVAQCGGCVGVIFAKRFLGGRSIEAVVDHILHIIDVAGEDVPALGSDFDGFVVPAHGLEDVAQMPRLTAALARRGLRPETLGKILGGNALRVMSDVPFRPLGIR